MDHKMKIKYHRVKDLYPVKSSNLSPGRIKPSAIVFHYTAGWDGAPARDWLLGRAGGTNNTGSSAHAVIDWDGTIWQLAPFNRRAWHAGPSEFEGKEDLNSWSIGLEFTNPGYLKRCVNGWADWTGAVISEESLVKRGGFVLSKNKRVGPATYAWPNFPEKQISAGLDLVRALLAKYRIDLMLTHEEIDTRGWKTDPGPAFPMQRFKDLL